MPAEPVAVAGVGIAKLVRMAEQITLNLSVGDDQDAIAARVADHLQRFWDPRMRKTILAYAGQADAEFSSTLRLALTKLRP